MMVADTVVAVIVTYNRLNLLKECITALRNQTYPLARIIVINNSSTDGTEAWLRAQTDIDTITQPNAGGAAGFYTGIKTAYENGYDWMWCMDDDGYPTENALEKLMDFSGEAPCVMNAVVLDNKNPDNLVFAINGYTKRSELPQRRVDNGAAFFNGTLIHREVVRKVGLPLKQLTIWGDETEYYNRIRFRYGFPIFSVADSFHYHPAQYSIFYKREWDVSKDWKVYFYVRNKSFVYASQYQSRLRSLVIYSSFLVAFAGTIIVYQRSNRLKKMSLLLKAAADGLRRNTNWSIQEVRAYLTKL